jgi:hypothetical protein
MDDEDLKKDVISQMMGELDDVTAGDLKRKPDAPVKGVEIAITVSPKSEEEMAEEMPGEECTEEGCEDPMHDHGAIKEEPESDYISQLMKKLG